MYKVVLQLPLSTTLVLKKEFKNRISAEQAVAVLPRGFVVIPANDIDDIGDFIEVPFKEDRMVEFHKYDNASKKSPEVGDQVWVDEHNVRGVVLAIDSVTKSCLVGILYTGGQIKTHVDKLLVLPSLNTLA